LAEGDPPKLRGNVEGWFPMGWSVFGDKWVFGCVFVLRCPKNFCSLAAASGLAVFSEGMVAFGAAEELRGSFISTTGLNLPNIDEVVAAFGAFLLDGRHCADFLVFLSDDGYELLEVVMDGFRCGRLGFFWCFEFDIAAFGACEGDFVIGFFGDESASAGWAKVHDRHPFSGLLILIVKG
jgi:hypothetical protein